MGEIVGERGLGPGTWHFETQGEVGGEGVEEGCQGDVTFAGGEAGFAGGMEQGVDAIGGRDGGVAQMGEGQAVGGDGGQFCEAGA